MRTTTEYRALGLPMQRQSARRALVMATYVVLAVLCALNIAFARTNGFWIGLYASSLVSLFVFGGNGRYGLVKPFLNRPPRNELGAFRMVELRLRPTSTVVVEDAAWRNDERELGRRDLAHYRAYQPITVLSVVVLLFAGMQLHPTRWIPVTTLQWMTYSVALLAVVLAATLPAAIILWTEPDAMADDEVTL